MFERKKQKKNHTEDIKLQNENRQTKTEKGESSYICLIKYSTDFESTLEGNKIKSAKYHKSSAPKIYYVMFW